jgi:mono/diheme cytochrome c family protein
LPRPTRARRRSARSALFCHGADGAGKVKGTPDLRSADVQKKSDADLASFIAEGGGKPTHAFAKKGLTDQQIKDVVTYIRTLKK